MVLVSANYAEKYTVPFCEGQRYEGQIRAEIFRSFFQIITMKYALILFLFIANVTFAQESIQYTPYDPTIGGTGIGNTVTYHASSSKVDSTWGVLGNTGAIAGKQILKATLYFGQVAQSTWNDPFGNRAGIFRLLPLNPTGNALNDSGRWARVDSVRAAHVADTVLHGGSGSSLPAQSPTDTVSFLMADGHGGLAWQALNNSTPLVAGVVGFAHGGIGTTSQQQAINTIAGVGIGSSTNGDYLRFDGVNVTLDTIHPTDVFPSQSGNSGKFLGSDGANTSWQPVTPWRGWRTALRSITPNSTSWKSFGIDTIPPNILALGDMLVYRAYAVQGQADTAANPAFDAMLLLDGVTVDSITGAGSTQLFSDTVEYPGITLSNRVFFIYDTSGSTTALLSLANLSGGVQIGPPIYNYSSFSIASAQTTEGGGAAFSRILPNQNPTLTGLIIDEGLKFSVPHTFEVRIKFKQVSANGELHTIINDAWVWHNHYEN